MTSLRTLEMEWQILLQKHPERLFEESSRQTQKVGLVIFGSDWGMCGQFNEIIADHTQKYLDYPDIVPDASPILCIGSKISDRLEAMDMTVKRILICLILSRELPQWFKKYC